jgi:type II secretory pathway pseudopilin PulG
MRKKGQVWVETVTYTLIAFILIGLVLTFVKPKIDELQDKAAIDQSVNVLKQIDSVVNEVYQGGVGNKRVLDLTLSQGTLTINSTSDSLDFLFTGTYMYSEPGKIYQDGGFNITTTQIGSEYKVLIGKNYPTFNVTYDGKKSPGIIQSSPSPYNLIISNNGGSGQNIDFSLQ